MSRPFGWRMNKHTGKTEWAPFDVCMKCQEKYPRELFPPGTNPAPGGSWREER